MKIAREEIVGFIQRLAPVTVRERWVGLLALRQDRWRKIDPWAFWENTPPNGVTYVEISGRLSDYVTNSFASRLNEDAAALACGHSRPFLGSAPLREIIQPKYGLLEGFVSINQQHGLVLNHDGMCMDVRSSHPG